MRNKFVKNNLWLFIAFGIGLIGGVWIGMVTQQMIFISGAVKIAEGFEGTNFEVNIDINETLMVDRTTDNMEDILWSLRMENCTRTEKGYCAVECYEDSMLIPCEHFTYDEHFCSGGICEADGGCPNYFEQLEGKTIQDCIEEEVEKQKSYAKEVFNDGKGMTLDYATTSGGKK